MAGERGGEEPAGRSAGGDLLIGAEWGTVVAVEEEEEEEEVEREE